MAASRRWALIPSLAGVTFTVLLNTWFAVASVNALRQSEQWLSHTWQVIGQVERVLSFAREAESSARGFVITGDADFLGPYYIAQGQIGKALDDFARLTGDNPHQAPHVQAMRQAAQARFASLELIVNARRTGTLEQATEIVAAGEGLRQMQSLRTIANSMEDEERRLLSIREEDVQRNSTVAFFAIALASGLDLLLIILVGRFLYRERGLRLDTEASHQRLALAHREVAENAATIQKLNTELEERVRIRTAELESTNRELEAFSYSVSHDLRAPLRTIDGFSLALMEDYESVIDETGRDYIQRVRAGVQRMGGLIDALLQLSRITRAEINREEVDVTAIVQSVATDLREQNLGQVIQFDIELGMHANADPHLLRVAFENLMNNAVKFSSKMPVSIIAVTYDPKTSAFQVVDNGAGFDMNYSSKLFNAFNRLHGDKDFKGSGIGLATVARVVRRHHGTISAESSVGNGARFRFTLG